MTEECGDALRSLTAAAARRFAAHDSEIGRTLAKALGSAPALEFSPPQRASSKASRMADAALDAIDLRTADSFAENIAACRPALCWREPGFGRLPGAIASRIAVTEIVGPAALLRHPDVRFGLLLQLPGLLYPDHKHAAEELYLTLSGPAWWSVDGSASTPFPPGAFVHHAPWRPHSMETREETLLALWGWTGDIGSESYDLAAMERARPSTSPTG